MGKNNRKRKQKEEDFKKVKLKVGKTRPAGGNETTTAFKSRSIVLPSQDTNKDGELTNIRKQSLKDLLSQMCHYSSTVRQEALLGLRNLFQQHERLLHENLGTVIEVVTEKVIDTDAAVRHSLMLLLRLILPLIPPERMVPFLPLVLAHLSCGMTHIMDDIQLESLGFLGIFLEHFPDQIIINSSQLLDNFIGLITHQSGNSSSKPKGKLGSSNLVVNPKGKLSSQKSRLRILNQLLDFLKALHNMPKSQGHSSKSCDSFQNEESPLVIPVLTDNPTHVQIFDGSAKRAEVSIFKFENNTMMRVTSTEEDQVTSQAHCSKEFMQRIIPLLLECWIECNPAEMSTSLPNNNLSPTALSIMATVMSILKVLLESQTTGNEKEHKTWLLSKYCKDFNHHFMTFFPFMEATFVKKKGKGKPCDQSADTLSLNITVCEVMSYFLVNNPATQHSQTWTEKLEEFVIKALTSGGGLNVSHVKSLLKFVGKLLHIKTAGNTEPNVSADELLSALFKLYQRSHLLSATKRALLQFFANVVFNGASSARHQAVPNEAMQQWLCSLPKLLIQLKSSNPEMSHSVVRVLSRVLAQDAAAIDCMLLNKLLTAFFDPAAGPFVHLSAEVQRSAIEVLFRLESIESSLLQMLVGCCNHDSVPATTVQYMLQVLHYRSPLCGRQTARQPAVSLASFLSVLFSVTIGVTNKQLEDLQTNTQRKEVPFYQLVLEADQVVSAETEKPGCKNAWKRHQIIQRAVCNLMRQCDKAEKLMLMMAMPLDNILDVKVLPLVTVHSILQLVHCLISLSGNDAIPNEAQASRPLLHSMTNLVFDCAVYCTSNPSDIEVTGEILEDIVCVLVVCPPLLSRLLCVLQERAQDSPNEVAMITKRLLDSAALRHLMTENSRSVNTLVQALSNPAESSTESQLLADLTYQHSMFTAEVRRALCTPNESAPDHTMG